MKKENADRLVERFQDILWVREGKSKWSFFFDCGDGWFKLLEETLYLLQEFLGGYENTTIRVWQVDKYSGELRIDLQFANGITEPRERIACANAIVDKAREKSKSICEECMYAGELREVERNFLETLCVKCAAKHPPSK